MSTKYLFITGGVCSSLGKGLSAAALALLLEKMGLKVAIQKFDPYLNVDPGTMSPYQHGEVYVTDDGAETDLDLGHYYRYSDSPLSAASNSTSGQIYNTVIRRERRGDYLGKCVQVIPHITDEIKARIVACSKQVDHIDVVVIEVGGTVGDIESLPFLEAIRQFEQDHRGDCLSIHLTYVPYIKAAGEVKTKPTQHSVQALRSIGIAPDIILCRCENPLPEADKSKIALFCNVDPQAVIDEPDVEHTIYEVPLHLHEQGMGRMICQKLGLQDKPVDLSEWEKIVETVKNPKGTVTVGVVGKYVEHQDAYKSVFEALAHAGIAHGYKVVIKRFESDKVLEEGKIKEIVKGCDGYLVPGGFGERGWLGKILTSAHCRDNKIPYFGICLGMQAMVVDFARHVMGWEDASSTEIDPNTDHPVISLLSEQREVKDLGGTMRLGAYRCSLKAGSKAHEAYKADVISERHRHRYEYNNRYQSDMEARGLLLSGTLENSTLAEIAEVKDHPWMVGVQFHPEFKSKPTQPHPLFKAFVGAMIEHQRTK